MSSYWISLSVLDDFLEFTAGPSSVRFPQTTEDIELTTGVRLQANNKSPAKDLNKSYEEISKGFEHGMPTQPTPNPKHKKKTLPPEKPTISNFFQNEAKLFEQAKLHNNQYNRTRTPS